MSGVTGTSWYYRRQSRKCVRLEDLGFYLNCNRKSLLGFLSLSKCYADAPNRNLYTKNVLECTQLYYSFFIILTWGRRKEEGEGEGKGKEGERKREKETLMWERNINWLPPIWIHNLGTCPNRESSRSLSVHEMTLQPAEPPSQGNCSSVLNCPELKATRMLVNNRMENRVSSTLIQWVIIQQREQTNYDSL